MSGNVLLQARGLTGPRGTTRVAGIDLDVARGRLLHVHGASGSGKTTLLRLLTRLDPLEHGTLRLDGEDAEAVDLRAWRRRVSLVFQEPRLFPGTIEDNLAWGARQHGLPVDAPELMDAVGLALSPERETSGLSGGEAKRVAIARALAVRPDVLLLDEPTGPLDAVNRTILRDLVRRLMHEHGLGVVLVSHLEEDMTVLPGHALVLQAGRVVDAGPSASLAKRLREQTNEAGRVPT